MEHRLRSVSSSNKVFSVGNQFRWLYMWLLLKAKDNFLDAKSNQDRVLCMQASSVHKLDDSHLCCVAPPELNLSGDPGKPALPLGKPLRCTFKEIGHQVLVIDVCLRLQFFSNSICTGSAGVWCAGAGKFRAVHASLGAR